MSRGLTNTQNTYLARQALVSFVFINVNDTYYYTDAPFNIAFDGNTYEAQGNFLGISETSENSELNVTNVSMTFSALDPTTVSNIAKSDNINQPVTVWRAIWDQETDTLIGDSAGDNAVMIFKGRISGYRIQDARDTATITLQVDSQFTDFEKVNCRRTNMDNFQREHSNDYSMEFSHETLSDLKWGKP